jgi:hypothetical protein
MNGSADREHELEHREQHREQHDRAEQRVQQRGNLCGSVREAAAPAAPGGRPSQASAAAPRCDLGHACRWHVEGTTARISRSASVPRHRCLRSNPDAAAGRPPVAGVSTVDRETLTWSRTSTFVSATTIGKRSRRKLLQQPQLDGRLCHASSTAQTRSGAEPPGGLRNAIARPSSRGCPPAATRCSGQVDDAATTRRAPLRDALDAFETTCPESSRGAAACPSGCISNEVLP